MSKQRLVILSGGFDPLHEGHIAMFEAASNKYDVVIVGVNSDEWLARKKGKAFQSIETRKAILESISYIDEVFEFDDSDNTAIALLKDICDPALNFTYTFGNGGDRTNNFPEKDFCLQNNIAIDDTLGGSTKANSSSSLLKNWSEEVMTRDWGHWKVLKNYNFCKVKELVVNPGCSLSWQKHDYRSEVWFVRFGTATIHHSFDSEVNIEKNILNRDSTFIIPVQKWHRLSNETDQVISIVEIQYGSLCAEHDIIRKPFPSISTRG